MEVLMAAARSVGLVEDDESERVLMAERAQVSDRALVAWTRLTEDLDSSQLDTVIEAVESMKKLINPTADTGPP
jgi:hypothetical protein